MPAAPPSPRTSVSVENRSSERSPPTPKEIAQALLKSTVVVIAHDECAAASSLGSAFVVTKGILMTNAHVLDGSHQVIVKDLAGVAQHPARVLAVDQRRDLALLEVQGLDAQGLPIAFQGPDIGDKVYVTGNPDGLLGSFSDGLVSAFREFDGCRLFQMTAPIAPGSSGGPVVNERGGLIGVSVGVRGRGENLNFAIHLDEILEFAWQQGFTHPAMAPR